MAILFTWIGPELNSNRAEPDKMYMYSTIPYRTGPVQGILNDPVIRTIFHS